MDTSLRLNERTALVTGACSSLGRAIAMRLSELGANVFMVDQPSKGGERLAEEILNLKEVHEKRGKAAFMPSKYSDFATMIEMVGRAAEVYGGLDIWIDCNLNDSKSQWIKDLQIDQWTQWSLEMKTTLGLIQKVSDVFSVRKRGRMIFLMQSLHISGFEGDNLSGITRGFLPNFIVGLAREFGPNAITANGIVVGPTEEYFLQRSPGSKSIKDSHKELFSHRPDLKIADPVEVANIVAFLASPLSSGISGQCLRATGQLL